MGELGTTHSTDILVRMGAPRKGHRSSCCSHLLTTLGARGTVRGLARLHASSNVFFLVRRSCSICFTRAQFDNKQLCAAVAVVAVLCCTVPAPSSAAEGSNHWRCGDRSPPGPGTAGPLQRGRWSHGRVPRGVPHHRVCSAPQRWCVSRCYFLGTNLHVPWPPFRGRSLPISPPPATSPPPLPVHAQPCFSLCSG